MSGIRIVGHKIWCPLCEEHVPLLRVHAVAKLFDVNARTLYRYIEQGVLHAVKVAGGTYRVCTCCLFKGRSEDTLEITMTGNALWCSKCRDQAQLISIPRALKTAGISERTVYRYIQERTVASMKVCAKTNRVCAGCLLKRIDDQGTPRKKV